MKKLFPALAVTGVLALACQPVLADGPSVVMKNDTSNAVTVTCKIGAIPVVKDLIQPNASGKPQAWSLLKMGIQAGVVTCNFNNGSAVFATAQISKVSDKNKAKVTISQLTDYSVGYQESGQGGLSGTFTAPDQNATFHTNENLTLTLKK